MVRNIIEPVKLVLASDVTFFGCPEEANPVSLYGQVQIAHGFLQNLVNQRVLVRATGTAKVFWDEECSYFAIMASRKCLLNTSQILPLHPDISSCPPYETGHNNTSHLSKQYMHTFPIQFLLEGHLPSSFSQVNDGISYSVDLVLVQDDREEILYSCPFKVYRCLLPTLPSMNIYPTPSSSPRSIRSLDLSLDSSSEIYLNPSLESSLEPSFFDEKWIGVHEGIKYCVSTPSCIILGQPEFKFKLILASNDAKSSPSSAYVTAAFKQIVSCQIGDSGLYTNDQNHLFQKHNKTSVSKTHSNLKIPLRTWDNNNNIPLERAITISLPLTPKLTEDLDCELIRIVHHVKLTLKLSRFASRKLELQFPVLVTSTQDLPPPYES